MPTVDGVPTPSQARVADGLAALYAGPGATAATRREARCFGRELAAATDTTALEEAGLLVGGEVVDRAPELPRPVAEQWWEAQQACIDFVEVSTRAQVDATKGRLDERAYAACLRRSIEPARIEAAVVATLTGSWDDPAVAELSRAQADCAAAAGSGSRE